MNKQLSLFAAILMSFLIGAAELTFTAIPDQDTARLEQRFIMIPIVFAFLFLSK